MRHKCVNVVVTVLLITLSHIFITPIFVLSADRGRHQHQTETREAIAASRSKVRSQSEDPGQCGQVERLDPGGDLEE